MAKAVIFDCFGVLITDALGGLVSEIRKKDVAKAHRIVDLVNAGSKGSVDALAVRLAIANELGLSLEVYRDAIRKGEVRNKPLLDYIQKLRATYKTALLSNIVRGGLEDRFPGGELSVYLIYHGHLQQQCSY